MSGTESSRSSSAPYLTVATELLIVTKLRQVEVLAGQGMARIDAISQISIAKQAYYRWRKHYGGMGKGQLQNLKRLQKENERLTRTVSDLTLDKLILAKAARGNC